ncbi:MAG: hypothetical protein HKO11_03540 [Eudoraea sp.]|nr:hypothetical protein [Eudoraea sp.]
MKFNWILSNDMDVNLKRQCIDLEYRLRPRITKFLMARLEQECSGDFSSFHFDVDMVTNNIRISPRTPSRFTRLIQRDFEREISGLCII